MNQFLLWAGSIFVVVGMYLLTRFSWLGWISRILGDLLLLYYFIRADNIPLLLLTIVYLLIDVKGTDWHKKFIKVKEIIKI